MKLIPHILSIVSIAALMVFSCNDTVYTEQADSPIKVVSVSPVVLPRPVSDGSVVTVAYNNDTTYSFLKISNDGSVISTKFEFYFHSDYTPSGDNPSGDNPSGDNPGGHSDDSHDPSSKQSVVSLMSQYIDLSDANFRKNINDEFYLEYYSTNNFGRSTYAVLKFDKDAQLIYQVDSTVNMMGGSGRTQTVTQVPVAGTPLNDGGYAMIFQTPSMGGMQSSSAQSYDLTMRIIDSDGKYKEEVALSFDESIVISSVYAVADYVVMYYQNENTTGYEFCIYALDGSVVASGTSEYSMTIHDMLSVDGGVYMAAYNNTLSTNVIAKLDMQGNPEFVIMVDAYVYNVTEKDGRLFFTGFNASTTAQASTLAELAAQITSATGHIIMMDAADGGNMQTISMSYDGGIAPYVVYPCADGGYDVYLTRVFLYDFANVSSMYGNKVYIYHTDDINKLQLD